MLTARAVVPALLAVMAIACAGCGSSGSRASSFATTPARAAVGFDASLPSRRTTFACPDAGTIRFSGALSTGQVHRRAVSSVRVGDEWQVTLAVTSGDSTSTPRYAVRHESAGFCVVRRLG